MQSGFVAYSGIEVLRIIEKLSEQLKRKIPVKMMIGDKIK
jgi:hypothetical protein